MANKTNNLLLLGKIAEGYDVEIAHENLANVFEVDLKKIPKLLKKPTIIRRNLTETDASRYVRGLEKIGIPCQIVGKNGAVTNAQSSTVQDDTQVEEMFSLVDNSSNTLVLDSNMLTVVDVKMPFGAMITFIVKLSLASIPALIIFWIIVFAIQMGISSLLFRLY